MLDALAPTEANYADPRVAPQEAKVAGIAQHAAASPENPT